MIRALQHCKGWFPGEVVKRLLPESQDSLSAKQEEGVVVHLMGHEGLRQNSL